MSAAKRVWIIQNGEELPSDPGPPRLLRQAILAELLTSRGHEVTFWTSTFNHQQKVQRPTSALVHTVPAGYRVMLLQARSYDRNVSVARIRSHREAAADFLRLARKEPPPDVVICGYPTIELAHAGTSYAAERGVPSIVDFRDQWPDIFRDQLPPWARPVPAPVFRYWRRLQGEVVRNATSICGITDEFVDWSLGVGRRTRSELDVAFPLSPPAPRVLEEELSRARDTWREFLGDKEPGMRWGTYAGSLGSRTDLLSVARAMRLLEPEISSRLRVVICGKGDLQDDMAAAAAEIPSFVYAGRRNAAEIRVLLSACDFGILAYHQTSDYLISYPNKLGEYLSYGLPVLTGLGGVTGSLLSENGLALDYRAGDPASCAEALTQIVRSEPDPTLSHTAHALYERRFNPEIVYPAYARHVERVAEERKTATPDRGRS